MSESTGESFFEGPEKKVELVVAEQVNLRELSREQWEAIISAAQAKVLSVRSTDQLDAYLLSESSLFVYDHHATMITCGRTQLADAVVAMLELVGVDNVELLVYERKNEHFPSMQSSTFKVDAARIRELVPGRALRFGTEHAHRIEVFASERPYSPDPSDVTLEVLMHGLDATKTEAFRSGPIADRTAGRLGLDRILPGFEIDEHAFEPTGYSLNGMRGGDYFTIHVTPESEGSYASFETNWDFRPDPQGLIDRVVEIFTPESFDVLAFLPGGAHVGIAHRGTAADSPYFLRKHVRAELAGYEVTYASLYASRGIEAPAPISLAPGTSR